MDLSLREQGTYAFGPFRLDPQRRTLILDGKTVPLTARLFDTLLYLVANADRLVERDELESAVWHGRVVEDGNLQKAVAAVRRALSSPEAGTTYIQTVSGRGFRFTEPVRFEPAAIAAYGGGQAPDHAGRSTGSRRSALLAGAAALCLLTAGGAWWRGAALAPAVDQAGAFVPPAHSVAVMSFTNLSGDPSQDYFSDGLSEELIDALGRIGSLRVPARLSAFSFKGQSATVAEIARKLNVGAVLEGSVRREGTRLRITAQLIDAGTGYQIWSKTYDRNEGDVLLVQADLASSVADALQVTMVGDDAARLTAGTTADPRAFDAYLRGMKFHNEHGAAVMRLALAAFDQALAFDPHFALAHVRRISCLLMIAQGFGGHESGDADEKTILQHAVAEARQTVALAPTLGATHAILGNALELSGQYRAAGIEQAKARELAPSDPWVNTMYGFYQMLIGHVDEGLAAARRAIELDPLSDEAFFDLAQMLAGVGRFTAAQDALAHALRLGLSEPPAWHVRVIAAMRSGQAELARATCVAAPEGAEREMCLAIAYHRLGREAEAEAALALYNKSPDGTDPAEYADIYAQFGRIGDALAQLELAAKQGSGNLDTLRIDPLLDPLRSTLRFKAIEAAMNFPP